MENLIPFIKNEQIIDGSVLHVSARCAEKCKEESCKKFYQKIKSKPEGYYECPGGYTVFHKMMDEEPLFYMGVRVKNHYKKVSYKYEEKVDVVTEQIFNNLIESNGKILSIQKEYERQGSIHKDLLHDIKKLDSQILYKSQELLNSYDEKDGDYKDILSKVKNINAMEELITCKYNVYDLALNIEGLSLGNSSFVYIYKKFDKIRYILKGYKGKNVPISFKGETDFKYEMKLSFGEILPFLILENAVKYTVGEKKVEVSFEEIKDNLYVTISSFGPTCEEDELEKITQKNYRGRNTIKYNNDGTGIGLYIVGEICNMFNIDLRITSDYEKTINGVRCGEFKVMLIF